MATYLFKTEPGVYAYADLVRDKSTVWDGVTNNAALMHLRACAKGDEVLFYHTGDEKQIVGLAVVSKPAFEDPNKPGKNARGEPKFAVVELKPKKKASTPVTLGQIKQDGRFDDFVLVRQARLSVMPVPPAVDKALRKLAGL